MCINESTTIELLRTSQDGDVVQRQLGEVRRLTRHRWKHTHLLPCQSHHSGAVQPCKLFDTEVLPKDEEMLSSIQRERLASVSFESNQTTGNPKCLEEADQSAQTTSTGYSWKDWKDWVKSNACNDVLPKGRLPVGSGTHLPIDGHVPEWLKSGQSWADYDLIN